MPLSYVTISELAEDGSGSALNGSATFTPSTTVYASGVPVLIADVPVQAEVINGQLKNLSGGPLTLLATDSAGLSYAGLSGFFVWYVSLTLAGQVQPQWYFSLPSSPSSVDLFSLAHTTAGGGGVTSVTAGDTSIVIAGTASAPTVATGTLDVIAADHPPAANWSNNSKKITGLANGTAAQDAAAFGQIPASLPPSGTAGGGLTGTYPNPGIVLDSAAGDIQPSPGTQAAGIAGKPADAGHVHGQPPFFAPTGLTGATAASRYAGAIVSGPPVSGTFGVADWVLDQGGAIWICVTAGSPGTWRRAGDQPWQFRPEAYGAKGDGRIVPDGTILGGSLSTLTCAASAPFANAKAGMVITVEGAGATIAGTSTPSALSTTIAAVVSSTQVTLTAPAATAVTARTVIFGTDDTAAINIAVTAGAAYATAGNYYFELAFKASVYMIGGALIQGGASKTNSQIPLPVVPVSGNPAMTMAITGTRNNAGPPMFQAGGDTTATMANGTVLSSTLTGCAYSGTLGQPAVIGGPTPEQGYTGGFTSLWNNLVVVIDGITVLVPPVASLSGMDLTSCTQTETEWFRTSAAAPAPVLGGALYNPVWSGGQSFPKGYVSPQGGNNAHVRGGTITAYGYATGVELYEQAVITELATIFNGNGCVVNGASAGHGVVILKWSAEANNTHLLAASGSGIGFNCVSMACENISAYAAGFHVSDAGNALHGRIGINTSQTVASLSMNGAANLEIILDYASGSLGQQVRGFASANPAVAATGVAVPNPFWRHATVLVTGSAITAVSVNGTSTGQLPGSGVAAVRVPSGASITLAYPSGTPAWNWLLD